MPDSDTVLVLGAGSTGEAVVSALRELEPDTPIVIAERELAGGECSYFACMPTKGLLRPAEALAAARRVPGAAEAVTGDLDAARLFWHRDQITSGLDDSSQAEWLESKGAELVRGQAQIREPGLATVGDREIRHGRLVIATGSVPSIPPIDGLDGVEHWTNREATQIDTVPDSITVVGAGPVGCEFAQFFRRMGARVAIVDIADRLLPRDHPDAGALLADVLEGEGIALHLGGGIASVGPGIRLHLESGESIEAERLLIATGRRAAVEGFGLEHLGLEISKRGIEVDERMRAAAGVWAVGDVTGIAMFTHVGKYHARVAAADMAGRPRRPTTGRCRRSPSPIRRLPLWATPRATGWCSAAGASTRCRGLHLRTAQAQGFPHGCGRSRPRRAGRRGGRRPGGGGVARPADAGDPRGGAGGRAARDDPALPDVLRGDPVRGQGPAAVRMSAAARWPLRSAPSIVANQWPAVCSPANASRPTGAASASGSPSGRPVSTVE